MSSGSWTSGKFKGRADFKIYTQIKLTVGVHLASNCDTVSQRMFDSDQCWSVMLLYRISALHNSRWHQACHSFANSTHWWCAVYNLYSHTQQPCPTEWAWGPSHKAPAGPLLQGPEEKVLQANEWHRELETRLQEPQNSHTGFYLTVVCFQRETCFLWFPSVLIVLPPVPQSSSSQNSLPTITMYHMSLLQNKKPILWQRKREGHVITGSTDLTVFFSTRKQIG